MIAVASFVRSPTRFLTACLMMFVCVTETAQAQSPVQRTRIKRKDAPEVVHAIAPQIVGGLAVAVEQINGVLLGFLDPQDAEDRADVDAVAEAYPEPKQQVILYSGSFDDLVYGNRSNAADARTRLDRRLEQKLEAIDRIIGLNDAQRKNCNWPAEATLSACLTGLKDW